jgi:phosphatidylserine/phosphatidylglycerophosphate/cardiolipin synthase-like enzyme
MTMTDLALATVDPNDTIAVRFLEQGGQSAGDVAGLIANFIDGSRGSCLIAAYDVRLTDQTAAPIRASIASALRRGIDIRLVYDNSRAKPQSNEQFDRNGGDFAEPTTHERVEEFGLPEPCIRAVSGEGLMHQKFIARDGEFVWTGTMNWTDDSMTRMENTLVTLRSTELAAYFERDFQQLWDSGTSVNSGMFRTNPDLLRYAGQAASTDVDFSPGQGEFINDMIARRIARARNRIVLCSMLINSSKVLNALLHVLDEHKVEIWGMYDRTQMDGVLNQWRGIPALKWKIDAIDSIMRRSEMIGKQSIPYHPGRSHNFMHNKMLVVDNTVITGSYNLSHSAQANSENMLAIDSPELAAGAIDYISHLRSRYLLDPEGKENHDPHRMPDLH